MAYIMDSESGEAAGLQVIGETGFFAKCDWQAVNPEPEPEPEPQPQPQPQPQPGGTGDDATPARVRPIFARPGANARQRGR